jgi:hypothetical protein
VLGAASHPEAWADRPEVPTSVVRPLGQGERIPVPAAVALFDYPCPREWAELLAEDLRGFFRSLEPAVVGRRRMAWPPRIAPGAPPAVDAMKERGLRSP